MSVLLRDNVFVHGFMWPAVCHALIVSSLSHVRYPMISYYRCDQPVGQTQCGVSISH